jgi:hypothetical protein
MLGILKKKQNGPKNGGVIVALKMVKNTRKFTEKMGYP